MSSRAEGTPPSGGVVVTGAASGIGRACAETLVVDGRPVALWDVAESVLAVADGLDGGLTCHH